MPKSKLVTMHRVRFEAQAGQVVAFVRFSATQDFETRIPMGNGDVPRLRKELKRALMLSAYGVRVGA